MAYLFYLNYKLDTHTRHFSSDVNGDGLEDIIIGAPHDDTNDGNAGCAYVVFGSSDASTSELDDVISGNGGFVIYGESENDKAGYAVSGGHDVNGDGLDDLAIGAPFADPNEDESDGFWQMMMRAQTDLKSMMLSVKPMLLNMEMVIIICNFVSRQTMARKAVMKFVQTTTALLPIIIQLRMM